MGRPVVHFEIEARDGEALRSFYAELFDWRIETTEAAPHYGLVQAEGNTLADGAAMGIGGGVSGSPERPSSTWRGPSDHPGHVTVYVAVPRVEEALSQAESLGAERLLGPDELQPGIEIGKFRDPQGRMIGLITDDRA